MKDTQLSEKILEALTDTTLTETMDLSYFFGPEGREAHIDPLLYSFPEHSDVKRLAIMRDVGDRMEDVRDIWDQIKNSGIHYDSMINWLWGFVALLVILTVAFFWWKKRRK